MVSFCPSCREPLVAGALRCRSCGADARAASASVGSIFRLDQVLDADHIEALDAFERLRRSAPSVADWYRSADDAGRRAVEALLAELRRLRRPGG